MSSDTMPQDGWAAEIRSGGRFEFGRNWGHFLQHLTDERIAAAMAALEQLAGRDALRGQSFLDVGCGSGLNSLVAQRLGASRVQSFDFDPASVACATELRRRFCPAGYAWTVDRGSVLDQEYLRSLGTWDIVYSWGVLHHTGHMWSALGNVTSLVAPGGRLILALYNDQGFRSRCWRYVKALYNRNRAGRALVTAAGVPAFAITAFLHDVVQRRHPAARYRTLVRGMSPVHDWLDWLGGYPFEVATPESVVKYFESRGFALIHLISVGARLGCNEFVFERRC